MLGILIILFVNVSLLLFHLHRTKKELFFFQGSLIPNITYRATPYPYVTKGTNVTLECTGSVKINPVNQGYMTRVLFRRNDKDFKLCDVDEFLRLKTLSCSVTVTEVTNNDTFLCLIIASRAPCNAAQLSFQLSGRFFNHI